MAIVNDNGELSKVGCIVECLMLFLGPAPYCGEACGTVLLYSLSCVGLTYLIVYCSQIVGSDDAISILVNHCKRLQQQQ